MLGGSLVTATGVWNAEHCGIVTIVLSKSPCAEMVGSTVPDRLKQHVSGSVTSFLAGIFRKAHVKVKL
jgi:hypothetical protein